LSEDENVALHVAKLFITGKVFNTRSVLQRFIRDNGPDEAVENVIKQLDRRKKRIMQAKDMDILRGEEGHAANSYFDVFDHLILHQKEDFPFHGRSRRPPKDEVNAMLSFVYTLIANEVAAALESVGLDPYVGFMHTLRPGRTSLALDMMEELRAYLGDRLVLSMINRKQVTQKDFIRQGDESFVMTDECRKELLSTWQKRKKEMIEHPYLKEKIPIGLLPYTQAMLLARYLREDLDDYPVFLMK
jgi:CRISPR-associated protein Cas1